jgi:hypothetical protein
MTINSENYDMTSTNYFPSINNNNNNSKFSSFKTKKTIKLIKKNKKNKNYFNINNKNKTNNFELFLTNSQKILKRNFSRDKLYSKNSFHDFSNNYITKNDLYYQ